MSKDVDAHELFKDDTFRTAFLSEMVDFVCKKKPHTLIIRDLEYAKIVRCKDCKWFGKTESYSYCYKLGRIKTIDFSEDGYCSWGERREDAD